MSVLLLFKGKVVSCLCCACCCLDHLYSRDKRRKMKIARGVSLAVGFVMCCEVCMLLRVFVLTIFQRCVPQADPLQHSRSTMVSTKKIYRDWRFDTVGNSLYLRFKRRSKIRTVKMERDANPGWPKPKRTSNSLGVTSTNSYQKLSVASIDDNMIIHSLDCGCCSR